MATPLTITLEYKGGAECWYEVKDHRGRAFFVGDITVHSLVQRMLAGGYSLAPIAQSKRTGADGEPACGACGGRRCGGACTEAS